MAVNPIPNGYHTVTPYLVVRGAAKMIEFAKKAFGAETVGEAMKPVYRLVAEGEGIVRRPFTIGGSPFTSKKVSVM